VSLRRAALLALCWTLDAGAAGAQIHAVKLADGLARPTFVTHAPDDPSRLFFLEQHTGNVRILDLASGSVLPEPFLTVPAVTQGTEQGLLGLAFHPDYEENGLFFVNRTDALGVTQIERYQVSPTDPNRALATPTPILSIPQPQANHNGGWLGFGPDGYLYASSGDGGFANDSGLGHTPLIGNAQDLSDGNLLGKMLRIDVDSDPLPGLGYAVPESNPFVGVAGDDRIWSYGLRNPWRASFDRETGDLWIGDVGQNLVEEVNFQPAGSAGGENYGWRLREGTAATPGVGGAKPPGAIDPVYQYLHEGTPFGRSVIGGYVYRGPIEALQGQYFFGDSVVDGVWSITFDGSDPAEFDGTNFVSFMDWKAILDPGATWQTLASFGEDARGNLYLVDLGNPFPTGPQANGAIYQIVPEPGTALLLVLGLAALGVRQTIAPRSRSAARRAAS
jgi:glucose/arabinose dehydrogenase